MTGVNDPCANPSTEYSGLPDLADWLREHLNLDLWDRVLAELQLQRASAAPDQIEQVLETAVRFAAAATGAIEGLYPITTGQTIMVAEQAPNWQTELAGVGATAPDLFEAQLAAYHSATALQASDTGMTAAGVRQLHAELCRPQAEAEPALRLGEYKRSDNCTQKSDGTIHRYARAVDVPAEVDRLWAFVATAEFQEAHPAVQAAYLHFSLAAIHPFEDGNGRVARAVTSAWLQGAVGMPLLVYADQRERYIRALEIADSGEYGAILRFIFDRCLDSMRFVSDRIAGAPAPGSEDFERLYAAQAGLSFQEVTILAQRVTSELSGEFNQAWQARNLRGPNFSVGVLRRGPANPTIDGALFRGTDQGMTDGLQVGLATPHPAAATVALSFGVFIAQDVTDRFPLVVANWDSMDDNFKIRLDDVHPANTTDFVIRRRAWVDRKLTDAIRRLYEAAKASRGP